MKPRTWWWTIGSLVAIFVLTIGILQFVKYRAFGYNGLDLGIYVQAVSNLAHGHGFASSIHDPSYLGDHVELWLILVAGIFRLLPSALTLLWTQTVILGLSVIPLAILVRRHLGPRAALVATGMYIVHPLVYNIAMYEFHAIVFALPLMAVAILCYERRHWAWWIIILALLALVREDMSLAVVGWAVLAAIDRRGWRWWAPVALLGTGWFIFAQHIIDLAGFAGTYKYLAHYLWLGTNFRSMAVFPFHRPLIFLQHVFAPNNWQLALGLLVGSGMVSAWRPRYFWPILPLFGQLILQGSPAQTVLHLHFVAPYLPCLAWALVISLRDIRRDLWRPHLDRLIMVPVITTFVIIAPIFSQFLFGPLEFPWSPWPDRGLSSPAALQVLVDNVGKDDRVLTTFDLLPALANRATVYSFNYLYLGKRQYSELRYAPPTDIDVALIDWQELYVYQALYKTSVVDGVSGPERVRRYLENQHLVPSAMIGNVMLYTRQFGAQPAIVASHDLVTNGSSAEIRLADTPVIGPATASNSLLLMNVPVTTVWEIGQASGDPISLRWTITNHGQTVWTTTRLLGPETHPYHEWSAGQRWTTTDVLAIPRTVVGDHITIEAIRLDGQYELDRWRSFHVHVSKIVSLPARSSVPWSAHW